MADDFDKEAPDAMEHQIVGETFPDFSVEVIKKEVVNFYDSEFESTISSVEDRKPFFQEQIGSNAFEALSSEITDPEFCQSNIFNCNKIILGSKPNVVHGELDQIAESAKPYLENNVFLANDTKLNPNSIDENFFEELVTSYEPKVELHDIQSYLHKSRRFCNSCGILFPEPNTYETHMQMFHTKTSLAVTSHKNNDLAKRRIFKCTHCDKKFVAPQVLRNHLLNIHRLKKGNATKTNKHRYKSVCNTMRQHRCSICGRKFVAAHVLKRHLINIHKLNNARVPGKENCQSIMNTVKDIKSPNVNRDITSGWSNTCFHCKKPFDTQKSLIEHLYDILQMKRKNTEIVPVFKSILFKCNKCDINFTSSQFAANHAEHMEMLINWKCTICNRIFKNEDALSHERQHSVSNHFLVYNLEDLDVTKILYKCSKCAIHFTESNFLYHFRDCGLEYSKFVNCKICNMSLDYNLKSLHESDKHTEPNYYTIIQSDVISDNPVKSTANKYKAKENLQELLKSFREVKVVLQKIDSSKLNKLNQLNTEKWCSDECLSDFESSSYEEIRNKAPELQKDTNASENVWPTSSNTLRQSKDVDLRRGRNLTFYFCKTCKCFVTKHKKKFHLEAHCKNISKEACKHCGLMLTTASLMTHGQLHKERKDLTLNNLKFFNLHNGQPMNPPGPEIMSINQYVDNEAEVENIEQSQNIDVPHKNRNLMYYYCETCKCCVPRRNYVHLEARCMELAKSSCKHCGLTFTKLSMMKHMQLHEERKDLSLENFEFLNLYNRQPRNPPVSDVLNLVRPINTEAKIEHLNNDVEIINKRMPLEIKDWRTKRNLTYYFCETCKCFVTKYRKEAHLEARCKNFSKGACKSCGLMFTTASLMTHRQLHKEKKDLCLNHFKFFNLYNGHPINPATPEVLNIKRTVKISKQHERRNLKYLYCETCKCFLTKFNKAKLHKRKLCKTLTKTICKYCGLLFTGASMMTHRRLHEERKDLTLNNFKFFNLRNGQPMNPPVPDLTSINQCLNNEAGVESIECYKNIENCHTRLNLTYYYCETCKCFITKFRKDAHLQGRCKKLAKMSCKHCGLMFTNASMVTHLRLHNEKADLSLKDFNFFNLYNGQPMNPPIPKVTDNTRPVNTETEIVNIKRPVDSEDKCLLRPINKEAEPENGNLSINIRARVVNENRYENIEGEAVNVTPPQRIGAEYEKLLVNNEGKALHFERPTNIEAEVGNENHSENIEGEAVDATPLLQIQAESKELFTNNESESLHFKRHINIEPKVAEIIQLVINKSQAENDLQPLNIEVKTKKQIENNESLSFERPINIDTEVGNENRPENIEGEPVNITPPSLIQDENKELFTNNDSESLHFKRPINIEPKVGEIIQLVMNKSQAENDLQPLNIEADIECRLGAVNNEDRVSKIQLPTNDEAEIEKLKLFVNNDTEFSNILSDINNEPLVESLEIPINSEAESPITTLQFPLNSGTISNNKTEDKNENRPVEHDAEDELIIQSLNSTVEVAKIKRPVNLDVWRSKSNLTYHYCENCKSYVTQFRKQTHLQARCKNLAIVTCKDCGLMFTNGSIMTHKRLHIENENLTLNNFTFLNLYNGQPMNPSIPEFENMEETVNAEQSVVNMNQPEVVNKQTVNPEDEVVYTTQPSNNEPKVPYSKSSKNPEDLRRKLSLTLYFCETCKCFVTKYKKTAHLQARCNILAKKTCKRCGLTFTSASMMSHKRLHEEWKDLTLNNFTFFNLNGQPMNPPLPEVLHTKEPVSVETKVVNIKQPASKEANDDKVPRRHLTYYFCDNCKCFITKYSKKEAHLQARCKIFAKSKCKRCGLKFTKASIMTHKRLHTENKELSLKNFKFFNLYNGQPMKAPTPKAVNGKRLVEERKLTYYYCKTCKCFVSSHKKTAHVQTNCMNMFKIPCKHCGLILSGTSFQLHKMLHEERKDLTLNHLKFIDLNSGQPMNPPIPEYPKCAHCTVYFLTITAQNSHICSDVSSLTCHICEIKLSEAAFKLHMTFHQHAISGAISVISNTNTVESNIVESATNLDRIVENDVTENNLTNTSNHKSNETDFHNSLDVSEAPLQRSSDMYSIVYCCRNCSVSVDTYDKAVEHSQTHYETYEHETRTILCNSCTFKIDETCYMAHQNLHESEIQFRFLHFDSYYLPAENNFWIKHIFKTLPNEEVLDILRNSIYRFECRIKMDVIQKGDPNFTVYKCDQCNCFVEPTSLFKHSDYACFKLRNHPCTVCGIAFNSSASRIDHEKIHIRPGLTTESYRIVVFNRERDLQVNRSFCLRKNYVLYKCRKCDVIIEKEDIREDIHKCDFTNVKNCPHCALLLNIKDYESHLNIHETFISFNYSNMKVVLLGESNSLEIRSENNRRTKFRGVIYDYKMFVCNKCEICIRNKDFMPKHICRFGKQRLKCLKCGLYFSVGRLKTHMRRHEQDPDFIRSNMYIISFDPSTLDQNKNATKLFTKDKNCELSDSNTDSDLECSSANDTGAGNDTETANVTTETVEEETVRIYKCSCDLHFLNEDSIFRHFGTCRSNPTTTKLKCHKCGLLFTPNVLFTHMLAHHNNKGRRYKYDIITVCYN